MVGSRSSGGQLLSSAPSWELNPLFLGGLCLCLHEPHRVISHNGRIMTELLQNLVGPAAPAARISSLERRAGGGRPSSAAAGCRIIILHLLLSCLYDCAKPKVVIDVGIMDVLRRPARKNCRNRGGEWSLGNQTSSVARWWSGTSGVPSATGSNQRAGVATGLTLWTSVKRMCTCVKILW